ncbi:MAG TPA: MBL fold metallo-hydrolase [Bryobacteraceae bacterium]|jgi:glyoxylase-like metal-dependent hydrolase (beta-lactamase superfamily II)|nr:MBL fold metallo-hydrolase [Bryobacteraceae bacterium]
MWVRKTAILAASLLCPIFVQAQESMLLPENSITRVSEHVYAIIGFPNIGIVVGSRATLVVDTGLGPRNGAIVMKQAEKLAKTPNLYLTTTHFHPEHAMGEQAFPPRTVIIRPAVQQDEMNTHATELMDLFRSFSAQSKELLADVKMRPPDIVFDQEIKLDLGGVTARLFWWGPAHTHGDEMIFVVEDSVLIPGDIVQDKIVPNMPNADASVKNWLVILDRLEPLKPRLIVPDHGALGDGSLIAKERAFLTDLQTRSLELKRQGKSAEEASSMVTSEFKTKYPGWQTMGPVANVVKRVYAENP